MGAIYVIKRNCFITFNFLRIFIGDRELQIEKWYELSLAPFARSTLNK